MFEMGVGNHTKAERRTESATALASTPLLLLLKSNFQIRCDATQAP
jgi:hypothetical protein